MDEVKNNLDLNIELNINNKDCENILFESIKYLESKINNNSNNNNKLITFIYGDSGIGKTTYVKKALSKLKYNIYEYNILSNKNKNIIEFYHEYNKQNRNIMDIFYNKHNTSILLIDNIDLINNIDKNTV